jgi:hypothetical protein
MDRLWTGYWCGGLSALAVMLATHYAGLDMLVSAVFWLAVTPIGMWLAKL